MQVAISTPKRNSGYVVVGYCNLGIVLAKQPNVIRTQTLSEESINKPKVTELRRVTELKRTKQH